MHFALHPRVHHSRVQGHYCVIVSNIEWQPNLAYGIGAVLLVALVRK